MVLSIEFASQSLTELLRTLLRALDDLQEIKETMRRVELCILAMTCLLYVSVGLILLAGAIVYCRRQMYSGSHDMGSTPAVRRAPEKRGGSQGVYSPPDESPQLGGQGTDRSKGSYSLGGGLPSQGWNHAPGARGMSFRTSDQYAAPPPTVIRTMPMAPGDAAGSKPLMMGRHPMDVVDSSDLSPTPVRSRSAAMNDVDTFEETVLS